jgi:hypothetical protein
LLVNDSVSKEAFWLNAKILKGVGFDSRLWHQIQLEPPLRRFKPGLFTMRGRRHGESLFQRGIVSGLWFRQVTYDVKLPVKKGVQPDTKCKTLRPARFLTSFGPDESAVLRSQKQETRVSK